jgi:hypothetical protein
MILKLLEKLQLLLNPRLIRCRNRQLLPSIPTGLCCINKNKDESVYLRDIYATATV